ncbi:MAG: CoA-binding protein [Dehalococcoidia bacterium]|nr:CoA-binding protein [Dehalococcoidia bacterium]
MNPPNLRHFLEPRPVAIVSARPGEAHQPFTILENLLNSGWRRSIYPVNPNYEEMLGLKCYADLAVIPAQVDLAVVATSRGAVPAVIGECARYGIRSAIVVSNGFADAGPEGRKLREELASLAGPA